MGEPEKQMTLPEDLPAPPLGDAVTLYVGAGVPALFTAVDRNGWSRAEQWLYLPDRVLEEVLSALTPEERLGPTLAQKTTLEENAAVLPLVIGGRVRAALVIFPGTPEAEPSEHDIKSVLEWLARRELLHVNLSQSDCAVPLGSLVTCGVSTDRFLRGALNLLVEQVPSGLAASYDESDGLYRLRTAVGNIAMWDILEGELPHATAAHWLESIGRGRHFIPVGFLPDRPMLLSSPPDFLFVHHGLQSDAVRSMIAMPVPGTISRRSGEAMRAAASMIAGLHQNCLGMTEDLISVCGTFNSACKTRPIQGEMFLEIFNLLSRRIGLSRLVFVPGPTSAQVVLRRLHAEPVVRSDTSAAIAAGVRRMATSGRYFSADIAAAGLLSEEEAKRYYLDNVKSEYCLSYGLHGECDTLVAFGLPETGSRLKQLERLLDVAGTFLHFYGRVLRTAEERPAAPLPGREAQLRRRLDTATALAEGHFHSMLDALTALSGVGGPSAPEEVARKALERLSAQLLVVRRLVRGTANPEPIPLGWLLQELPAVFEGAVHQIQDAKNIAVTIVPEAASGRRGQWTTTDACDYLYPALAALMQEAICSGEIRVREVQTEGRRGIQIKCARSLIAHTSLRDILQRALGPAPGLETSDGSNRLRCGAYEWLCQPDESDPQVATLIGVGAGKEKGARRASAKSEVR